MVVLVVGDVWVANIGCVARNLHVVFRQGVGYFLTLILNTTIALVHLKTMKLERTKIAAQVNVAVGKKVVMSAISTIHAAVVSKDKLPATKKNPTRYTYREEEKLELHFRTLRICLSFRSCVHKEQYVETRDEMKRREHIDTIL